MISFPRFVRRHVAIAGGIHLQILVAGLFLAVDCREAMAFDLETPSGLPAGTSMVCGGEQSIGFRWVKGRWKSTDFIPNRYLIEKRAAGQARSRACRDMVQGVVRDPGNQTASMLGCYMIRREGDDAEERREQVCLERWRAAGKRWVLDEVACDNFRFRPDGWFHRTSLHGELSATPPDDRKEPLSVSVGHCRLR